MAKVICDICGTAYPDTASQCPICGSAKTAASLTAVGDAAAETAVKTHVKGGRFSTANVRKRNRAVKKAEEQQPAPVEKKPKEKKERSNLPLVILLIVLLLAICAVLAYIGIRYFLPAGTFGSKPTGSTEPSSQTEPTPSTQQTEPSTESSLSCTGITLAVNEIDFGAPGRAWLLAKELEPKEYKDQLLDQVTYESSDESVASVSDKGRVVAVGPGEAIITVRCGEASAECKIVCSFETAPTDPSGSEEGEEKTLTLDRDDITFSKKGETFRFDTGSINASQITWTSDNEAVCIVVNGLATAVGHGTTDIHAEFEGQTVSCVIRCTFTEDSKSGKVTTDSLNIRSSPSTSASAVGYYVKGDKVEIFEEKTGDGLKWGRTDKGWICLDYVSFD